MYKYQEKTARVVFGPDMVILGPQEDFNVLSLSGMLLLIREQIHFKLALFVYKCLHKTSPSYLSKLLSYYTPPRILRSTLDITHLNVPRANQVLGQKSFQCSLTNDLEQFSLCH